MMYELRPGFVVADLTKADRVVVLQADGLFPEYIRGMIVGHASLIRKYPDAKVIHMLPMSHLHCDDAGNPYLACSERMVCLRTFELLTQRAAAKRNIGFMLQENYLLTV